MCIIRTCQRALNEEQMALGRAIVKSWRFGAEAQKIVDSLPKGEGNIAVLYQELAKEFGELSQPFQNQRKKILTSTTYDQGKHGKIRTFLASTHEGIIELSRCAEPLILPCQVDAEVQSVILNYLGGSFEEIVKPFRTQKRSSLSWQEAREQMVVEEDNLAVT